MTYEKFISQQPKRNRVNRMYKYYRHSMPAQMLNKYKYKNPEGNGASEYNERIFKTNIFEA